MVEGKKDHTVGFEVVNFLDVLCIRRGVLGSISVDPFIDVTQVYSRLLGAVEIGVKHRDLVVLPLDKLFVSGLAVTATMVIVTTTHAHLAKLLQRVVGCKSGAAANTKVHASW
jgi:hypothetical protein